VICALTASVFEHDRPAILAAGCDDVLAKPFREDTIFAVLEARIGVRYEEEAIAAAAHMRLADVPVEQRAALKRALVAGDDLEARRIAAQLSDAALSADTVRRIAAFEIDDLIDELA
jgi:DNA-binding response OmpR family regulator